MREVVLAGLLLISLFAAENLFSQNSSTNQSIPFKYALFTSSSDVALAFYKKNYKPVKLTKEQLVITQSIIKRVSDSLNFLVTSTNTNTRIVDTLKHVFQIVSAKDSRGKIYLWVNAICDPDKDWRRRIVFVDDSGSCYYTFKVNLDKARYFDIRVNANG